MCHECLATEYCTRRFTISYFEPQLSCCDNTVETSSTSSTPSILHFQTVLQQAAFNNNITLVLQIVKRARHLPKFNINHQTSTGGSALIFACQHGFQLVVQILLRTPKIDVNQPLNNGRTPLFMACQMGYLECVQHLVAFPGIDLNKAKDTGETPLLMACQEGYLSTIRFLLLQDGIKLDCTTIKGRSALHIACFKGRQLVVQTLLASDSVDENIINLGKSNGKTPLFIAIQKRHPEVVRVLLNDNRIQVNLHDNRGATPLWIASKLGELKSVEMLLKVEGIHTHKKALGMTALEVAKNEKHSKVVALLQKFLHVDIKQRNK